MQPTYKQIGDHTETVEIDFNPAIISYGEILELFWKGHHPNRKNYKGRQYMSLLLYHDKQQKNAIEQKKTALEKELHKEIQTEVSTYRGFTLAEERHQKYFLKRYPDAIKQLTELYPSFTAFNDATLTARLNSFVRGLGTMAGIKNEISQWPVSRQEKEILLESVRRIRW